MSKQVTIKRIKGEGAGLRLEDYPQGFELPKFSRIEELVAVTQASGKHPLWDGYADLQDYGKDVGVGAKRSVAQVRSSPEICRFYAWLVCQLRPETVLEFGAAFGVSGMYWLAGLESVGAGELYSFEVNPIWHEIAGRNMAEISPRHHLRNESFEAGFAAVPPTVDLAMIDAIHTRDFVVSQYALVQKLTRPGAVVIFDDINFSKDMRRCWAEVREAPQVATAWEVNGRVGIVQHH